MIKVINRTLDRIAKQNGYSDRFDLLRDYGFIPTVLIPKHRKIEVVTLLYKLSKKSRNNG